MAVVNLGYLLTSLSKTVDFALWANKIAYLGQVFVPMCMFMIISKLCGFAYKKWFIGVLITLAVVMFAIVFTTGWLDWYYVSVTIGFENGGAYLIKEYGALHPTNLIYVVAYFVAMLTVIAISLKKSRGSAQKVAGLMLAVVLGNIGMWLVEKIIPWHFEMLAVSYLMSETIFFFLYFVLQDYIQIKDVPPPVVIEEKAPIIVVDSTSKAEKVQTILAALPEGVSLSARQMDVLEGILDGKSRKTIASDLCLSENTVKMHTSALYRLLNVSSRDEIFALLKK
jgi:DNA-binding CsgD family transcriptional regulator